MTTEPKDCRVCARPLTAGTTGHDGDKAAAPHCDHPECGYCATCWYTVQVKARAKRDEP